MAGVHRVSRARNCAQITHEFFFRNSLSSAAPIDAAGDGVNVFQFSYEAMGQVAQLFS